MKDNFRLKFGLILAVLASFVVALPLAVAGMDSQEQYEFKFVTSDGGAQVVSFDNLAVGEVRTVETESGQILVVTRTATGMEMDLDGELINVEMPKMGLHPEHDGEVHMFITDDGGTKSTSKDGAHTFSWSTNAESEVIEIDCGSGVAEIHVMTSEEGDQREVRVNVEADADDADSCHASIEEAMAGLHMDSHGNGDHQVIIMKKEVRITEGD